MLKDNSQACKAALKDAYDKWLYACGEMSVSAIRPLIPVDTGDLKTTLDYKIDENKGECTVGVSTPYAIYVEYGTGVYAENNNGRKNPWIYKDPKTGEKIFTRGSEPRPYMRPGFRQVKPRLKKLLPEYVSSALGGS